MSRIFLFLLSVPLLAQTPSPVQAIRSKLSAGDLLSAESLLEVYRKEKGDDANSLEGLSWLARGAALMGDWPKASRYASETRAQCDAIIAKGTRLESDRVLLAALGASIEVQAEAAQRTRNAKEAVRFLDEQLARFKEPVALRSRIYKRRNMIALTGQSAPELQFSEHIGAPPMPLASLKGKPVVLFLWASWCGDCKAQAAAISAAKKKYAGTDLAWIAPTRFYESDTKKEKSDMEKVWRESYADLTSIPAPISTETMERYGVSSTPTFVFIDRSGKVRRYTPTRLTEAELSQGIDLILRK
ncbi:MAG: TlpA family protein disulfide reductase [Bryobacterales bacterium]|nr:TlpA family protein disulfide reductase [Bryobacterales bacterium]